MENVVYSKNGIKLIENQSEDVINGIKNVIYILIPFAISGIMCAFHWNFVRQIDFMKQTIAEIDSSLSSRKESKKKRTNQITFELIYQKQCLTSDLKFNENHHVNSMASKKKLRGVCRKQ